MMTGMDKYLASQEDPWETEVKKDRLWEDRRYQERFRLSQREREGSRKPMTVISA